MYYGRDEGERPERTVAEFAGIVEEKKLELERILEAQKPIKAQIAELYKVKLNIEKYLRPEFVFGPLYTGNTKALVKW